MLQEVGHSVVLLVLGPRARIDPKTHGGGGGAGILAGHAETIVQLGHLGGGYVQQGLLQRGSRLVAL